jgi:hypothetical protein
LEAIALAGKHAPWHFAVQFNVPCAVFALGALPMAFDFVVKLGPLLARNKVAYEVRQ